MTVHRQLNFECSAVKVCKCWSLKHVLCIQLIFTKIIQGEEVATFKYGGSAVLTLFKRDRIKWDTDLRNNSQKLWETKVKMGERVGCVRG